MRRADGAKGKGEPSRGIMQLPLAEVLTTKHGYNVTAGPRCRET